MKKLFLTFLLVVSLTAYGLSQTIPNAGFENWSFDSSSMSELPSPWTKHTILADTGSVTRSADAYAGNYSVRFQSQSTLVNAHLGFGAGEDKRQPANGLTPAYLTGYYKASLVPGDSFGFSIDFRDSLGIYVVTLTHTGSSNNTATWTPFHIPLQYLPGYSPLSYFILINMHPSTTNSVAWLDEIAFSNTPIGNVFGTIELQTGGTSAPGKELVSSSVYPNPANGKTTISFTLQSASDVQVRIYDLAGRTVVNMNERKAAGDHRVEFNSDALSGGLYFYTISGKNFSETKKFVIGR